MNDSNIIVEEEFVLRRLSDQFPFVSPEASVYCWWALTIGVLLLGCVFVALMYIRDSRTCRWYAAVPLAMLRMGVYVLLAFAFLLPAKQTWETSNKRSRVLIMIDISPSVTEVSDDISRGNKPKTRIDNVLNYLTDENVAFIRKLTEKNPVFVYRFGTRLDEEPQGFNSNEPLWTTAEWQSWIRYDFKPWILKGLSPNDRDAVTKMPGWNGTEPGAADWAIEWAKLPDKDVAPMKKVADDKDEFALENAQAFRDARSKLEARVDVARTIVTGTNLPDSLTAVVNREASNMAQAVIVFSDGRSNLGLETTLTKLHERPGEKVPIFTIAVGEPRDNVSIAITDVQAPDRAAPDEAFKVIVEADGVGLEKKEVDVKLSLYLPARDPKKDTPDDELLAKLLFEPGEPPHGRAEILVDPEKIKEELTEIVEKDGGKKRVLKQGTWNVIARIARDPREVYPNPEHLSPPRKVSVLDSPLRVLLWASGPTREYQTLRTLLAREVGEKRAEVSIFLQNEGGASGTIAQDVDAQRLLVRFPTRNIVGGASTPEDKYYNLNEYDLIIAFDPDWSELSNEQIDMIRNWVTVGGGGFVYIAGPINTHQLARSDEAGRMKPLLEMMPVLPADRFLVAATAVPRTPRRLALNPNPLLDVLKLDDMVPDDSTAGWERFFTGRLKYVPAEDPAKNLTPTRGFFSFYPVTAVKPGTVSLADFLSVNERGEAEPRPYLVVSSPQQKGRAAFIASGEIYRIRYPEPAFYDRFWIRFARAMTVDRRNVQSFRGQVLVNKEYTAGSMVRVSARILAPNSKPYPPNGISPKFRVEQYEGTTRLKEFGPFPFAEKKASGAFDGYYQAQVLADARQFPPGEYRYRVIVDVPDSSGDTITGEFMVRKSNPELDNTRPDFTTMILAASTLEEVKAGIKKPEVASALRGPASSDTMVKMAFKLSEAYRLALIPDCIDAKFVSLRSRGPVDDLWDRGANLGTDWKNKPVMVSYILIAVVSLLGMEWLFRKLTRLA